MDMRQIGIKLAMDSLGLSLTAETFADRLILQKTIYLVEAASLDLGYFFTWELRGPYCRALAGDGTALMEELDTDYDESKNWAFDEDCLAVIKKIRPLFESDDRSALAQHLELLASVHFLLDRQQVRTRNPSDICSVLKEYGKPFSEPDVSSALEELHRYGFTTETQP